MVEFYQVKDCWNKDICEFYKDGLCKEKCPEYSVHFPFDVLGDDVQDNEEETNAFLASLGIPPSVTPIEKKSDMTYIEEELKGES